MKTKLIYLPAFFLPVVLFVAPLLFTVAGSFRGDYGFTLDNYIKFFTMKVHITSVINSLLIAFLSTAMIIPLGIIVVLIVRGNERFKNFMKILTTIPAVFPSYVFAVALIYIYGSRGILNLLSIELFGLELPTVQILFSWVGIIFANVMFYMPFFIAPVFASTVDPSVEEAAKSLGSSGLHLIRHIILPALKPGIVAGSILTLLLTFNEFGVVLFLGWGKTYTLTYDLYAQMESFQPAMASTVAVVILLLSSLLVFIYRRVVK